jgi:hypothetical protein
MSVAAKFIKLNMGLPFAAFHIFILAEDMHQI